MLHCYTNTNTLHMTFLLRIRRKRRRNPAWSIADRVKLEATCCHKRTPHSLPSTAFLFLCEEANYVVVPTREHQNTRVAYPVLQRCCLSYERNINKCLHLSSHCVKCQVVERLRNFRVLVNRTHCYLLQRDNDDGWRGWQTPRPPTTLRPQLHSLIAPSGAQPTQSACH